MKKAPASLLPLLLIASLPLPAQTAKVIALSPEDAREAKILHDQQVALDKKVADLREAILVRYLTPTDQEKKNSLYSLVVKPGWDSEFVYSEDFKFIVPSGRTSTIPSGTGLNGGCMYLNPVTGLLGQSPVAQ